MKRIIMIDDQAESDELFDYASRLTTDHGYVIGPSNFADLPTSRVFEDTNQFFDYFENIFGDDAKSDELKEICAIIFDIQIPVGDRFKDQMIKRFGDIKHTLTGYLIADYLKHKYLEHNLATPCFIALTNTSLIEDSTINYEGLFIDFLSKHPKAGEREPPFIRNCRTINETIQCYTKQYK